MIRLDGWLRLASHYGWTGTIKELQEKWPYREYKLRLAWLDNEWNRPNRSDWFLMRIAQRIQQFAGFGSGKHANKVTLEDQQVTFESTSEKTKKTEKTIAQKDIESKRAKAIWKARLKLGKTDGN